MDLLSYQRTVFGFHGCDKRVADAVLTGKAKLSASENTYDWLARGIYFWEHGPMRALEWAIQQSKRKNSHIKEPAVIGAVIQLGTCFDLLDVRFTRELARYAASLEQMMESKGQSLPRNQRIGIRDGDWLRRERDCFVLKYAIPAVEVDWGCQFDSVRGVFQEGAPAFKGAGIKLKSHIQIAVRDPRAIIGYFLPDSSMLQTSLSTP
ncbi:MAG: hypothetical protein IAE77_06430 [Prosthecobacter sp.]|uniref:hypothetical protein n=1 Tax=Prosthecobacter sp. TaxID=1965333 RepID=UPI0019E19EB8|nr:hypothetical protein [Prosthecobacter sp.]MBE2283078.1 hypothetical protein [Prosthecobacter sp.]